MQLPTFWRRPPSSKLLSKRGTIVLPALLMALVLTLLCCRASSLLSVPEFELLDLWFRARPTRQPSPEVVLIGVDADLLDQFKATKDELGRQGRLGAPRSCTCASLARDVLAQSVQRVKLAGAKVTAVDFVFELPCPLHDRALLKALALPGHTVLLTGTSPTPGRYNFTDMPSFLALSPPPLVASPVLYNPRGVIRGVRLIQEEDAQPGSATSTLNIMRVCPPLAVACYMAFRDQPYELPETVDASRRQVRCLDTAIPVLPSEHVLLLDRFIRQGARDAKHAMLISWAGNIGTYPMYSMKAVLQASPEQLTKWFAGKIVLIGSTADRQLAPLGQPAVPAQPPLIDQQLPDQASYATPVEETASVAAMSGLEIHANALDTILQRRFITPLPDPLIWLLMLLVSWLTIICFERLATWKAIAAASLQLILLFIAAAYLLRHDLWLYAFTPAVCVFLSAITGAVSGFSKARHTAEGLVQDIEARDAVTTTLVHDLKQPLGAINMLAQILRQHEQAGKTPPPELIQRIQQQVQTALGDIDELLVTDPHRDLPLRPREFDVCALARDLAVTQSLKSTLHQVEVQAPAEGLWLKADARYLGRALSNLMDNAIKYWPAGGTVVVEIRGEPGQVTIRVIDGGLGIAPGAQSRLFGRFQRAVPAGCDIPGTGIGLFSVKRIVEAHGGTVHLVSAPGEGSIFSMVFPNTERTVELPLSGIAT